MGYYLVDHPPASPQYRAPRRQPLSGVVVVHTAEGGPALNVASFISRRPDPGSYHVLTDPGMAVPVIPDEWEAFHVAADSLNRSTWGISAAWTTKDWQIGEPRTEAMLATMADEIRSFAHRNGWDPATVRWVTRDEALAARGTRLPHLALIGHGTCQPADRTDAWTRHPQRDQLDARLAELVAGATTPTPTEARKMIDTLTLPATHPDLAGCGLEVRTFGQGGVIRWQVEPGGAWSPLVPIPAPTPAPVVLEGISVRANPDGALQVVGYAGVNAWTAWQSEPNGPWKGWQEH